MPAVQMNTRIDSALKRRGDDVAARAGFTPSQVVRAVWGEMDRTGDVLPFMRAAERDEAARRKAGRIELARKGAGLALRIARDQCGFEGRASDPLEGGTWCDVRDAAYDDMLDEMLAREVDR